MTTMHAAVVTAFGAPPRYGDFPVPTPGAGEQLADVLAVGLHPRVRSGAAGRHYTSTGTLPMVPGVDGVARRADGTLVYFAAADDVVGTMAERAVLSPRRSIELPAGVDTVAVAAAMNPAMSSWVALRRRAPIRPGQAVLVLGATGNAGTMAVQVAKRLGAGRVVGAGRDRVRLDALTDLGADEVVRLSDDADATSRELSAAAAEVDIVLDYLWSEPARLALSAIVTARADRSRTLHWVQIGAITGPDMRLPSVVLRSADVRLLGAGQGAVSPAAYAAELPSLVAEIEAGNLAISADARPLADVEACWTAPEVPGRRIVFVP